jgi:hypothetical protein
MPPISYQTWKTDQDNQRWLRTEVDRLTRAIVEGRITDENELGARSAEVEALCRDLFPGKDDLFRLIYQSRFRRLWEQFGPRTG